MIDSSLRSGELGRMPWTRATVPATAGAANDVPHHQLHERPRLVV